MNEHLHIGIENPSTHRKQFLAISIDTINILTRLEKISNIRSKKAFHISKLNAIAKKLSRSMAEFKESLPSAAEPSFLTKEKQKTKEATLKKSEVSPVSKNLEDELRKLKEKI